MDILPLLDELQTIARTGLNFTESPYDRERYERLLQLAVEYYGQALDLPPADVRARLAQELGYITPKVGAEAGIFDEEGRILLVQRSDDQDLRREAVRARWGDKGVIDLAMALQMGRLFPMMKLALGYARECRRLSVDGRNIDVVKQAA